MTPELNTENLPPITLPPEFGPSRTVHIYLYRGPEIRLLHPWDRWRPPEHQETRLFTSTTVWTESKTPFAIYIEPCTLKTAQPLWFTVVIVTWNFISHVLTTFANFGGGGRGTADDDSDTIAYLFEVLRAFPKDWPYFQRPTRKKLTEPPKIHVFGEGDTP